MCGHIHESHGILQEGHSGQIGKAPNLAGKKKLIQCYSCFQCIFGSDPPFPPVENLVFPVSRMKHVINLTRKPQEGDTTTVNAAVLDQESKLAWQPQVLGEATYNILTYRHPLSRYCS